MKYFLSLLMISNIALAKDPRIEDAPLEWLITSTIQEKINNDGHLETQDKLVSDIFKNIKYDSINDEIILTSNKETYKLRKNLVHFLNDNNSVNTIDKKYDAWRKEGLALNPVTLYRTTYKTKGFYYLNHIHTNLSQDNDSLRWLKFSPKSTFRMVEKFLKRRHSEGTVAFTDHDTDKAFDHVKDLDQSRLNVLRGVEWGGKTHMCLAGIKENWENLPNGRTFSGEESIIQSRSSDGFRIINHPNRKKPFPYTSWLQVDGVEVWNTILENSPFLRLNIKRSNNRAAFQQWVDSLKLNKNHTAVAGSDFHFAIPCLKERSLIYPANFIPAEDKSLTEDYLKQGRVSFITRPTAPKLTLLAKFESEENWSNMGDELQGTGNLEVRLYGDFSDTNKRIGGACYNVVNRFYRLFTFWKKRFWEIRFYNLEGEVIAKRVIRPKKYNYKRHFKAVFNLPVEGQDIVRAELWQINRKSRKVDLLGATNPIYINWSSR